VQIRLFGPDTAAAQDSAVDNAPAG